MKTTFRLLGLNLALAAAVALAIPNTAFGVGDDTGCCREGTDGWGYCCDADSCTTCVDPNCRTMLDCN